MAGSPFARRSLLVTGLLAVVLALAALAAAGPRYEAISDAADADAAAEHSPRPNVLVIMTDDQTVESMRVMPKTRALLGGHGTTFANSFVAYPLCCPSRATFLTGQYAHNHGVLANQRPLGGYTRLDHSNTLPVWLQAAGYDTAHVGKYLNRYGMDVPPEVPPGWDRWFGLVDPTSSKMFEFTVSDEGALVTYGTRESDYQTDVLAEKGEEVVRAWAETGRPWFLTVAPLAPHLENSDEPSNGKPPRPAPRHAGRFAREPVPAPPSFDEADVADKPAHIRRLRPLPPAEKDLIAAKYRARLETLLAVDDLVERLVEALEESGQLERTVILFTSDNGFFHGEHRIEDGKYHPYEEAIRVPLIVRGGGFPAGHVAAQPVSNVDLAPTIVALTGAKARRVLDGRSLLPVALDSGRAADRALLVEGRGSGSRPTYEAVRAGRFMYVEYKNGDRELYDLATDPWQIKSRHADPKLAKNRASLARKLAKLRGCAGAGCK